MPTFDNYTALLYGINKQLNDGTGSVEPRDVSPGDPGHLLPHHLALLSELQQALGTRRENPAEAMMMWQRLQPILVKEAEDARSVTDDATITAVETLLREADRDFVGAAYRRAEAAAEGHLEAPDMEEQRAHLERAEEELLEANKLWEDASRVMAEGVDQVFGLKATTTEIIELVRRQPPRPRTWPSTPRLSCSAPTWRLLSPAWSCWQRRSCTRSRPLQAAAMDQVNRDAENTWQGVRYVTGVYLEPLSRRAPDAYESMGYDATNAFNDLTMPAEAKEGVIALAVLEKVEKIFHGANLMARYVQEHYTN